MGTAEYKKEAVGVKVAQIAMWQAVLVALITAGGGVIAGYFASANSTPTPSISQKYLVIHGVTGTSGNMVRVVARVNGLLYAYPADVPFTEISLGMPEQKLPLPITTGLYTISFQAQVKSRTSNEIERYESRSTPAFDPKSLPTDVQSHEVFLIRNGDKLHESFLVRYSFG